MTALSVPAARHIASLQVMRIPGSKTYLQDVIWVPGAGPVRAGVWVMGQAVNHDKDTRFHAFDAAGKYLNSMTVLGGEHGASFFAYRSAAGRLYLMTWVAGHHTHRILWQPGKTVRSGTDMHTNARPLGGPGKYMGLRVGHAHTEDIWLTDRFEAMKPGGGRKYHKITVPKPHLIMQTQAVSPNAYYRLSGETSTGAHRHLHQIEKFNWAGHRLGAWNVEPIFVSGHPRPSSWEPEGLCWRNGKLVMGKRMGGVGSRTMEMFELAV